MNRSTFKTRVQNFMGANPRAEAFNFVFKNTKRVGILEALLSFYVL